MATPASSHSLRLTAMVPRARRSIARLILVVLTLCAAGWSTAQAPAPQPRADQEPITPIPLPPVQDPRQVGLGDRLFHDPRLSHDNTRSCNSCHDTSTNGASVGPPDSRAGATELNIPTVFNAALNFRLKWEGDLRTLEGQIEESLGKPQTMGSSVEEALHKLQADPDVARSDRGHERGQRLRARPRSSKPQPVSFRVRRLSCVSIDTAGSLVQGLANACRLQTGVVGRLSHTEPFGRQGSS